MERINVECHECNLKFTKSKVEYNRGLRGYRKKYAGIFFCSGGCASKWNTRITQKQRIDKYKLSPKFCKECNTQLRYDQRMLKFCNQSCAATHNNPLTTQPPRHIKCAFCDEEYVKSNTKSKFCSMRCSSDNRLKLTEQKFHEGEVKDRKLIHRCLVDRDGDKCSVCGIESWNEKSIRLWVDHINGNAADNRPTNFRLICPNCESQSDTFSGKNCGRGRKSRGLCES
jgi:hypothetical protein